MSKIPTWREYARTFADVFAAAEQHPPEPQPIERAAPASDAPAVMIFAPHPDDECIIGGLPLRLQREAGMRVINVAVTLGSNEERRTARRQELKDACEYLGFELILPGGNGLERIDTETRENDPSHWSACAEPIAALLNEHRPAAIFYPHAEDWNTTHIGVHYLIEDALETVRFSGIAYETEFWGAMDDPNLMVESSAVDVGDLVAALTFHRGEIARNPYHLRLPAVMMDSVRRGAERLAGQGGAAPDFVFGTLYRRSVWNRGDQTIPPPPRHLLPSNESAGIMVLEAG